MLIFVLSFVGAAIGGYVGVTLALAVVRGQLGKVKPSGPPWPAFSVDDVLENARKMMPPTAACKGDRHAECERPRQCSCACHAPAVT